MELMTGGRVGEGEGRIEVKQQEVGVTRKGRGDAKGRREWIEGNE